MLVIFGVMDLVRLGRGWVDGGIGDELWLGEGRDEGRWKMCQG